MHVRTASLMYAKVHEPCPKVWLHGALRYGFMDLLRTSLTGACSVSQHALRYELLDIIFVHALHFPRWEVS